MTHITCVLLVFFALCLFQVNADLIPGFRAPAVPLIVRSPYLSIWSVSDNLYDTETQYWDGNPNPLHSYIRIDGNILRLMGTDDEKLPTKTTTAEQISVQIFPTQTIYSFNALNQIQVNITFTTPLLVNDYDKLSLPITYITYQFKSLDNKNHSVQIYFDIGGEFSVQNYEEVVEWKTSSISSNVTCSSMGTLQQAYMKTTGDRVSIDWGYGYLCSTLQSTVQNTIGAGWKARMHFIREGNLPPMDSIQPRPLEIGFITMSSTYELTVSSEISSVYWILAYDQVWSINYFDEFLAPYWRRDGTTPEQMLTKAYQSYDNLMKECSSFDKQLISNLTEAWGDSYATLASAAYRQSLASSELVWKPNKNNNKTGEAWYMLKEISSDGDLATVDVTFPACPLLFILNPDLVKKQILPVFEYANNETSVLYTFRFAPHHLGSYPVGWILPYQQENMPVEETGNLLLMTAGITLLSHGDTSWFYPKYWDLFNTWGNYLVHHLPDPGNQLCTDDFEGPSPHNVNLAAKGIVALGAFSYLCNFVGEFQQADYYMNVAKNYTIDWQVMAFTMNDSSIPYYKKQYNLDVCIFLILFSNLITFFLGFLVFKI